MGVRMTKKAIKERMREIASMNKKELISFARILTFSNADKKSKAMLKTSMDIRMLKLMDSVDIDPIVVMGAVDGEL